MPTIRRSDGTTDFVDGQGRLVGRWAGRHWSDVEIYGLMAAQWGHGWRAVVATALCLAESGGYEQATGDYLLQDEKWGPSEGLMQIRVPKNAPGSMFDPQANAREAYKKWYRSGWRSWGAFTNLSYLKFMLRARAACKLWAAGG